MKLEDIKETLKFISSLSLKTLGAFYALPTTFRIVNHENQASWMETFEGINSDKPKHPYLERIVLASGDTVFCRGFMGSILGTILTYGIQEKIDVLNNESEISGLVSLGIGVGSNLISSVYEGYRILKERRTKRSSIDVIRGYFEADRSLEEVTKK